MGIKEELQSLHAQGLLRSLRTFPGSGGKFLWQGRQVLNFSSNDYLNLASDERVKAAAIKSVEKYGCGSTASQLMSGHLELHEQLESDLARLIGGESALIFGSGFLTNMGVLTALAGRKDEIFADKLCHASIIDGMRLSGAKWTRYNHNNAEHLESLLTKSSCGGRRIVVSDSIFSMDGDIAPLKDLCSLANQYDCILVIDEAHAIGVMGEHGGGLCREFDSGSRPDVIVGTMSKSLGGYGGFAVCCEEMRQYFINRARSFIYSTGLPPACLAGASAAISIIESTPGLGKRLLEKVGYLHDLLENAGFEVSEPQSQILPVYVGDNEKALELSQELLEQGVLASAVRPPTVPQGTARLRLSVTLAHSEEDLQVAADKMAVSAGKVGLL